MSHSLQQAPTRPPGTPTGLVGHGVATPPMLLAHDTERDLYYTWYDRSPDREDKYPRRKAIETSLLAVTEGDPLTGPRVGYLRVSFTTPELMAATFKRPLQFAQEVHGWSLGYRLDNATTDATTDQALVKLWLKAHLYAKRTPDSLVRAGRRVPSYQLEAHHAPDVATLEADLAVLEQPLIAEMAGFGAWHAVPYVAVSRVTSRPDASGCERYLGTGIGTRMYLLAADQLATTGRVLCGSGIQSDDAQALWRRLQTNPAARLRTVTKTSYGPHDSTTTTDYLALDHTR